MGLVTDFSGFLYMRNVNTYTRSTYINIFHMYVCEKYRLLSVTGYLLYIYQVSYR